MTTTTRTVKEQLLKDFIAEMEKFRAMSGFYDKSNPRLALKYYHIADGIERATKIMLQEFYDREQEGN